MDFAFSLLAANFLKYNLDDRFVERAVVSTEDLGSLAACSKATHAVLQVALDTKLASIRAQARADTDAWLARKRAEDALKR